MEKKYQLKRSVFVLFCFESCIKLVMKAFSIFNCHFPHGVSVRTPKNRGQLPCVSLCLLFKGFSVDFEKVSNLPCGVTHAFTVKFNPDESKLKMGHSSVLMPVQVQIIALAFVFLFPSSGIVASLLTRDFSLLGVWQASHGGRMQVQLCAVITQPTVAVSPATLEFDTLQCGMCQVIAYSTLFFFMNKTSWGRHNSQVVPEYVDIPYPDLQL